MAKPVRFGRIGGMIALVCALAACSAQHRNHGYVPADDELAQIEVGRSNRDDVALAVGRPSAQGILADSGWYYVQSRFRHMAYNAPAEINREVVAISFDPRGVVENVERFGLEDGRPVVLSRRVTDTTVGGVSFLGQLFGNLGVVRAEDFFSDGGI